MHIARSWKMRLRMEETMPTKYFASTDTYVELKDTMKLQKASLNNFAKELEYCWYPESGHYYKIDYIYEPSSRNVVSLLSMQNWHNGDFSSCGLYSWHGEDTIVEAAKLVGVKPNNLQRAVDSKLVQTTHLQYSKKQRKLLCTDHQIQFA